MDLLFKINDFIIQPAALLIFSFGFFLFLFGLVEFLADPANESRREKGKQHMLWGIVGMFIMISAQGIIVIIRDTFGLDFGAGPPTTRTPGELPPGFFPPGQP